MANNLSHSSALCLTLPSLNLSVKSLFTGCLLAIGFRCNISQCTNFFTHAMADGKFGLSIDDIVYSYYGDPSNSKIETNLNGSMRDKASSADKLKIIKWVRSGAPEDKWQSNIKPVLMIIVFLAIARSLVYPILCAMRMLSVSLK